MVLVCFLLEDRHLRQQGVTAKQKGSGNSAEHGCPTVHSWGQGRGKWPPGSCPPSCAGPQLREGGAFSPEMLLFPSSGSLNAGFLPVAVFYLLSVPFTVTMYPQGRGGPVLPTKPVIYTAKGRLCADKGDLLVRESACSPALSPGSPLSAAGPPALAHSVSCVTPTMTGHALPHYLGGSVSSTDL